MSGVTVVLEWDADPQLTVEETDEGLQVVVACSLSERQIAQACAALGPQGEHIHQAWREAVGLESGGGG